MEGQIANYISLKDAAFFCDHSPDYLNLLVRKGKLKALKIGRNWVTKKEWLEKYMASQGGEKLGNYISLKDAAFFCDHSPDYLNLLVRKGKLKALKIGRNWVTKKEWLENYLQSVEQNKLLRNENTDVGSEAIPKTNAPAVEDNFKMILPELANAGAGADAAMVLPMPVPRPARVRVIAGSISGKEKSAVNIDLESREKIFAAAGPVTKSMGIAIVCAGFAFLTIFFLDHGIIRSGRYAGMATMLKSSFVEAGQISLPQAVGENGAKLMGLFVTAGKDIGEKFSGIVDYLMNGKSEVISIMANAIPVEKIVYDESVKSLEGNIIDDTQSRFDKFRSEFGLDGFKKENQAQSVIVVPSSGDAEKDEQTKIKIEDSFSDNVVVKPTDDTSGVIVPQFKNKENDEYLYMTVPINKSQ